MYPRLLANALAEATADTPAVFIAGARQTGKSTLAEALAASGGWTYRSLDDLVTLAAARSDPQGFVDALAGPTVLDEVQRAPELFLPLKRAIDRGRRPGRFVLTGSADVLALPRVADSLAGRMELLTLWPLAQCELERVTPAFVDACFEGRPDLLDVRPEPRAALARRMLRGGYPEVVARGDDRSRTRWFGAYVATLLQRDVRELSNVERLADLPRLLEAVAARTGGPLNVADLGRALGWNQVTTKRYLSLLEAVFLVVRLPPWFENVGKRLARTPKLYLADPGLLAHALRLDAGGLAARPADAGPLAETFAVAELMRLAPHARARPRLYHLRTSAGAEVDVVLEGPRRELVGVEVKAGATVSAADFRSLALLRDAVPRRFACGVVLHGGDALVPFGPKLWAVPMAALWSGLR